MCLLDEHGYSRQWSAAIKYAGITQYQYQYEWSGVGAQGDPCTAAILRSIVRSHLHDSVSSPVALTKYCILYNGILSQSLGSIKMFK
jgi:hypothetical protein